MGVIPVWSDYHGLRIGLRVVNTLVPVPVFEMGGNREKEGIKLRCPTWLGV